MNLIFTPPQLNYDSTLSEINFKAIHIDKPIVTRNIKAFFCLALKAVIQHPLRIDLPIIILVKFFYNDIIAIFRRSNFCLTRIYGLRNQFVIPIKLYNIYALQHINTFKIYSYGTIIAIIFGIVFLCNARSGDRGKTDCICAIRPQNIFILRRAVNAAYLHQIRVESIGIIKVERQLLKFVTDTI